MNARTADSTVTPRKAAAWIAGITLALGSSLAAAQNWPTKQIRLVIPFPPSGPTDFTGRLLAQKLSEQTGQPAIVDNKVGGGTVVGTDFVAKSAPDGHTILMMPVQVAIVPALYEKLPYDLLRDLTGITQLTNQPYLLVAHPATPYRTVPELVAYAKANPEKVRFASSGIGGGNHLAFELFNKMAGTKITHVPYKGAAPALNDLIGGQVEVYMPNPITSFQHVKSGKLRAIATTGAKRVPQLPDLPTVAETLPGFDAGVWFGLYVPSATPRDTVRRIYGETQKVLQDPAVRKNMTADGGDIIGSSPEEFAVFMKREVTKWAEIVKFSGAKAE
jgi:tripartite-type tricarboxylate transporter receptor subunit TctC